MCKRIIIVWALSSVAMLASMPPASAATKGTASKVAAAPQAIDLTLDADSQLAVSVPTDQSVVFWDRNGEPLEIRASGHVSLAPGAYTVQAGDQLIRCRVWAHGTAPPAAVETMPVIRGQSVRNALWRLDALTPPAIIITGLGLGLWAALDSAS